MKYLFRSERSFIGPERSAPRRRGIALLLVMIGLVVCTLLTAGFLSSQGTAIGIARNERDAEASRLYAQTGIDLCYSLVRNKAYWRESMSPGTWVSNYAVGNGTVTVVAASGDGTNSFANDTTQPVIFTSTGTCNGRTFTLTGTIGPTGGGTVFRGGNFVQGSVTLGTPGLTTAIIDSYNSLIAPYNALLPGSNALVASNSTLANTLTVTGLSVFRGSFTAGPSSVLSSVVNLVLGILLGPSSTAAATESRSAGSVIPPNFAGQTSLGAFSQTHGGTNNIAPGVYDSYTTTNAGGIPTTIFANGSYEILHDMNATGNSRIQIANGANVVLYVIGNTTLSAILTFNGTGTLTIYSGGNFTATGSMLNATGSTTSVQLLGLPTSGAIQLNNSSQMAGVIFAPQAAVTMKTGTSKMYGAIIAHDISIQNTAQFHYDQATTNVRVDNVTGGSAPLGTALYNYSVR